MYNARYWIDPGAMVANGPFPLQVNAAGDGDLEPHYGWKSTIIRGPLSNYYGRTYDHFLSLGWKVLALGYDWRLGVRTVAGGLWDRVRVWAGEEPVYLLGHSLGGMVGRAMLRLATEAGRGAQVKRLLTLGTPQQGSLSIPFLWARQDRTYRLLAVLFYPALKVAQALLTIPALDVLDSVVATLVSPYSLLPQPGSPVFTADGQYSELMDRNSYTSYNGHLSQERFDAAKSEHTWIQGAVYPDQQLSVIGLDLQTASKIKDVTKMNKLASFEYTTRGDGQVDADSASLPGVKKAYVYGVEHFAMPYDPAVLPRLPDLLVAGL